MVVADGDQRVEAVAHRRRQTLRHAYRVGTPPPGTTCAREISYSSTRPLSATLARRPGGRRRPVPLRLGRSRRGPRRPPRHKLLAPALSRRTAHRCLARRVRRSAHRPKRRLAAGHDRGVPAQASAPGTVSHLIYFRQGACRWLLVGYPRRRCIARSPSWAGRWRRPGCRGPDAQRGAGSNLMTPAARLGPPAAPRRFAC